MNEKKLSLVAPCYNEGAKIYENLLKMSKEISKFSKNYEIICVMMAVKIIRKKK